jgi:anti-sigma B factor antagonist
VRSRLMDLTTSTLQGVPVLVLAGEIGHESCPALRRTLEELLPDGVDRLLLDFSEVEYIDSGCLGLMWTLFKSAAGHGWLGVIGANTDIRRILSVAGFVEDDAFRLFTTRADAKHALVMESAR